VDFPVNFTKRFIFLSFFVYQIVLSKFLLHCYLRCILPKIVAYDITEVLTFYADKLKVICNSKNVVAFNLRFYSNGENLLLTKSLHTSAAYMFFTAVITFYSGGYLSYGDCF